MIVLRRTRFLPSEPPSGPIFHAATYLRRAPGWSNGRAFSRWNREVERQLGSASGALAYSVQRLLVGREFWTLSLWSHRESMLAFIRAGSHRAAADWLNSSTENFGKFAQWEAVQPTLNVNDASERLGAPRPGGLVLHAPTAIPVGWRSVPR